MSGVYFIKPPDDTAITYQTSQSHFKWSDTSSVKRIKAVKSVECWTTVNNGCHHQVLSDSSVIPHRHTEKSGSNLCSLAPLIIQPCKNQPTSDAQTSSNSEGFATSLVQRHGQERRRWGLHGHQFPGQSEWTRWVDQDLQDPECFHLVSPEQKEVPATSA